MAESAPRLIDLRLNWPLQYAPETTLYDPALYPEILARLPRLDGYLGTSAVAFIACERTPEDWTRQSDPWAGHQSLLARVEAEFSGRLLIGPDDFARWRDEPDGLTWAVLGVAGLDHWMRSTADLDRMALLVDRGVRVFRLGSGQGGVSNLDVLRVLFEDAAEGAPLAVELPADPAQALAWFEADPARADRLIPLVSGIVPNRLGADALRALRSLGGILALPVGPPGVASVDDLRRAIGTAAEVPFQGRSGLEGIAIATDFLDLDETLPELGTAGAVVEWLGGTFPESEVRMLVEGNGRSLVARLTGVNSPEGG